MDYQIVKIHKSGNSEGVHIPQAVRKQLNLKKGDYLKLTVVENKIVLEKVK